MNRVCCSSPILGMALHPGGGGMRSAAMWNAGMASHSRDEFLAICQLVCLLLLLVLHVISVRLGVVGPAWLLEEVLHEHQNTFLRHGVQHAEGLLPRTVSGSGGVLLSQE